MEVTTPTVVVLKRGALSQDIDNADDMYVDVIGFTGIYQNLFWKSQKTRAHTIYIKACF